MAPIVRTRFILALSCLLLVATEDEDWILDLSTQQWSASSVAGPNDSHGTVIVNSTVPGDIFMDLYKAYKITDPYLADNDVQLRWISNRDWTYTTTFQLTIEQLKDASVSAVANGIDTIATVYLNGAFVFPTDNMFLEYVADVTKFLQPGQNKLELRFKSPTVYANSMAKKYEEDYGYSVPPSLQTPFQNGMPNVNFIRKVQSSFSWDWGPGFATVGLLNPLVLHGLKSSPCLLRRASAVPVAQSSGDWLVRTRVALRCRRVVNNASVTVSLPEIPMKTSWNVEHLQEGDITIEKDFSVAAGKVSLWWPNGYGSPKLYNAVINVNTDSIALKPQLIRIGFRKVELVQDAVMDNDAAYGNTFYFKINDLPIFLKGTNWIPDDAFLSRVTDDRLMFLYESMLAANMNCLLIWGGGIYESDRFYEIADERGILIWHYMMFAVSLYPSNVEFLSSVEREIVFQVNRLQHHPSLFVWSGNVENELGLRQDWFGSGQDEFDRFKNDYMMLYNDTVGGAINRTDLEGRPYLLSSPSNGVETVRQGGVAKNPASEKYGDVHFYNYFVNAWRASNYPISRCASEYGFQSLPSRETLDTAALPDENWSYLGPQLFHRQHHAAGNLEMMMQVLMHFKVPPSSPPLGSVEMNKESYFLDAMIYLTQAHQAIAYQVQTEHYRRWRNRTADDGRGQTMCALYWQLNDIWQAPSWASIDYGLKWKMVHYYAKRFFAPVIVSPVFIDDHVDVYGVSDLTHDLHNSVLVLEILSWASGFQPIYTVKKTIDRLPSFTSMRLFSSSSDATEPPSLIGSPRVLLDWRPADLVFRARLLSADGSVLAPANVLLPDRLFDVSPSAMGKVTIGDVRKTGPKMFTIALSATSIAPIVWLDLRAIRGYFADNGFTMVERQMTVDFYTWTSSVDLEEFRTNLTVKTLRDWYV